MNYWLDLFTGTSWREFQDAGATTSGFRARKKDRVGRVKAGDIFLCYLTHVMRWVGALEIAGSSSDKRRIWQDDEYPVRLEVRPLVMLSAENGIPMEELEGKVTFYASPKDKGKYSGFVRTSPNRFLEPKDAELILNILNHAVQNPVSRPVDPKKLAKKPFFRVVQEKASGTKQRVVVSVPEPEEPAKPETRTSADASESATTRHTEVQYELLALGAELGLDVWVAGNGRGKVWNGTTLGSMQRMLQELPVQFDRVTTRTIELIDVVVLRGNSIVGAFEVECTTSVYSGLLRMSDLLALQPNLDINLYLVAPDERRSKVEQELLRPTFRLREKPLNKICGFLAFRKLSDMRKGIDTLGGASHLKPTFLKGVAEFFVGETLPDEEI
jgi:hypothetical protein